MLASPAFVDVEIPPHVTCISSLEPAPVATRHKELVAIYFYFIIFFVVRRLCYAFESACFFLSFVT